MCERIFFLRRSFYHTYLYQIDWKSSYPLSSRMSLMVVVIITSTKYSEPSLLEKSIGSKKKCTFYVWVQTILNKRRKKYDRNMHSQSWIGLHQTVSVVNITCERSLLKQMAWNWQTKWPRPRVCLVASYLKYIYMTCYSRGTW